MCPYFDSSQCKCRVTPSDSAALQDSQRAENICKSSAYYPSCGNYEAAQRGDYKVVR